jgi:hypothetical protein
LYAIAQVELVEHMRHVGLDRRLTDVQLVADLLVKAGRLRLMPGVTRVYLETGKTWTFACAVDWPGWCRRGKSAQQALDTLSAYAPRYAVVAGGDAISTDFEVVGRIQGDATTDFGAPSVSGKWDDAKLPPAEADRIARLLEKTWTVFDGVVATARAELRKGPRGGGRDRDAIVEHVREAERSYGRKFGVRLPPRTTWDEQRAAYVEAIRAGAPGQSWSARYAARRLAWHVMDHVWEIEDRSS